LEDQSVWQLTAFTHKRTGEWFKGQEVQVSQGASPGFYKITNLKVSSLPFIAKFLGFQS